MGRAFSQNPVTLTATYASVGEVVFPASGTWASSPSRGRFTVRLKHAKHASQSGGYPVVRALYRTRSAAGTAVYSFDPILDPSVTFAGAVGTVKAYGSEVEVRALTDSDGTVEYDLVFEVSPGKEAVKLEAKQAGDTTNFGTLYAELEGAL